MTGNENHWATAEHSHDTGHGPLMGIHHFSCLQPLRQLGQTQRVGDTEQVNALGQLRVIDLLQRISILIEVRPLANYRFIASTEQSDIYNG
ncbi:hypothetical protein D3C81_1343510 [compost metagenome]